MNIIGIYISEETSATTNGVVVYLVTEDGKRVRNEIAPDMVEAYGVPVLN